MRLILAVRYVVRMKTIYMSFVALTPRQRGTGTMAFTILTLGWILNRLLLQLQRKEDALEEKRGENL